MRRLPYAIDWDDLMPEKEHRYYPPKLKEPPTISYQCDKLNRHGDSCMKLTCPCECHFDKEDVCTKS